MQQSNLDEIDPTFPDDLEKSMDAVWLAARIIHERIKRCDVTVNEVVLREHPSQAKNWPDRGDIIFAKDGRRFRVEAKHRESIQFTSAEDFPFDDVIVDVAHSFDRAEPKPVGYMIFNAQLTHFIWIDSKTSEKWTIRPIFARGRTRSYYLCPIALARFHFV